MAKELPGIVQAVRQQGHPVLWVCDPMHANTETTRTGIKTRRFEKVLAELEATFQVLGGKERTSAEFTSNSPEKM